MRPQDKQLRIVELLPGGEQVTSRSLRFAASLDDRGDIAVQSLGLSVATDLIPLLSAAIAAAAAATGMPATMLASIAGQDAEDELRRGGIMADLHDRIARLATEAQSRADVAGTQAAWQEGRAHGLREAAAAIATATDTRIRDYIASLDEQADAAATMSQYLTDEGGVRSAGLYEGRGLALRQVAEALRGLLVADEPEGAGDE